MRGTILVTGSLGLIGVGLSQRLTRLGWNIIGLDMRGSPALDRDVRNATDTISQLDLSGIIHLAAVSRVIDGEANPRLCRSVNVDGTRAVVAGALSVSSRPWLIYASSREVYGQQSSLPVDAILSPINVYARSKVDAESVMRGGRQAGLKTVVLRFFECFRKHL